MEIQIDDAGLSKIATAGQMVTLTRRVKASVVGAAHIPPTVAWQAFAPMQKNAVRWSDRQYYCFMTTTPLAMNAIITMNAQSGSAMQIDIVYQFAQGRFSMQQRQQGDGSYIISNAADRLLAFGLAQSATVNDTQVLSPLCVVPVLNNETAYFSPSAMIGVFLSTASAAGTLLPPSANGFRVSAPDGAANEPIIGFDDRTNTFYQIS
jgi:hypothetical protein